MLSIFKAIGGPGSIGVLAACCAIGLVCRAAGAPRLGRAWLLCVYLAYVVGGLPIVANGIASNLSSYRPLEDLSVVRSADAIIVLHGDNVRGRVREATRMFAAVPGVEAILVSGDRDFTDLILAAGIPRSLVVPDSSSRNTFEQIASVGRFVRTRNIHRPVLVASRLQMPRIAALLRASSLDVVLAPSPIDDEPPTAGVRRFIPMYIGLRVSRDAIYELIAIRYYANKRLIAPDMRR